MEFELSDDERSFQDELRQFLAEHPAPSDDTFESQLAWQRTLHTGSWVAPHWPEEVGGRGCTAAQYVLYLEEMGRHRAPQLAGRVGINMVGPTILAHGTPSQCAEHLPGILSGDDIWCEMFSEPDAGSDLASVSCRARLDGDTWVVTGSKVWSSFALEATKGVVFARSGERDDGRPELTYLICDMSAPGIEVRPLRQITGEVEFAEVFLDEVRIPRDWTIGAPGTGWSVMRTTLDNERGLAYPWKEQIVLEHVLDDLLARARSADIGSHLRMRLVDDVIAARIFRLLNLRTLSLVSNGATVGSSGSITKLFWANYAQHLHQTRFELDGPYAIAGDEATWRGLLWYRQASIAGGTSEIQRNIIGERSLGLPREPRG